VNGAACFVRTTFALQVVCKRAFYAYDAPRAWLGLRIQGKVTVLERSLGHERARTAELQTSEAALQARITVIETAATARDAQV
jgi:hypothetical protein